MINLYDGVAHALESDTNGFEKVKKANVIKAKLPRIRSEVAASGLTHINGKEATARLEKAVDAILGVSQVGMPFESSMRLAAG